MAGDRVSGEEESPNNGLQVGPAIVAWIVGAGILGGSWALHRVESSLDTEADKLVAVQEAQTQGATIDWDGRTANINPGSLDAQATDEMVDALVELEGVAEVNIRSVVASAASSLSDTELVPEETTATTESPTTVPPTTVPPTTVPPTTVPPTTVPPTTVPPTTQLPTTMSTLPPDGGATQLELLLAGRSIEFVFSTAVPTPETEALLDELHDFMQASPELTLHITGHTDPTGNETANQLLSEARAQSIANHLIIRGIDAARMTTAGKGSTEPIADNATVEGQNRNRRVVIEAVVGEST